MATSLPTNLPISRATASSVPIASAIMGLRFDKVMSIKWEVRPSVGLVAKDLRVMGQVVKSARVPLTLAVQHVIIPSIKENFESEGRPSWDNLNKGTILQRFGAAHPILHRTGTLEEAATSFGIWDIGEQSATVRRLPLDAFYGVYHQAGSTGTSGGGALAELMSHAPHSSAAEAVISRFVPAAKKELGPKASASHVRNRAIGLIIDSEGAWSLPARPFIMWQPEDVPKIELIFSKWMEGVAVKEGGFRDIG